jgi:hypothetical protein
MNPNNNINFKASDHEPLAPRTAYPAGVYVGRAIKSEKKPNNAQNGELIAWEFEFLAPAHVAGKIYYENMNIVNQNPTAVEIANRALSSLCHATGVMDLQNTDQLLNIPIGINLGINKKSGEQTLRGFLKAAECTPDKLVKPGAVVPGAAGGGFAGAPPQQAPPAAWMPQQQQAAPQQAPAPNAWAQPGPEKTPYSPPPNAAPFTPPQQPAQQAAGQLPVQHGEHAQSGYTTQQPYAAPDQPAQQFGGQPTTPVPPQNQPGVPAAYTPPAPDPNAPLPTQGGPATAPAATTPPPEANPPAQTPAWLQGGPDASQPAN